MHSDVNKIKKKLYYSVKIGSLFSKPDPYLPVNYDYFVFSAQILISTKMRKTSSRLTGGPHFTTSWKETCAIIFLHLKLKRRKWPICNLLSSTCLMSILNSRKGVLHQFWVVNFKVSFYQN